MKNHYSLRKMISWALILLVFWIAVSGKLRIHDLVLALFVVAFIIFITGKINNETFAVGQSNGSALKKAFGLLQYIWYIVSEIVAANLHVASIILSPKMKIAPGLVKYKHGFKQKVNAFIYANSITLTPGTLTVGMDDEHITVHVLEDENRVSLENWKVEGVLKRLEVEDE